MSKRNALAEVIRYSRGEDASVRPSAQDYITADAVLAEDYSQPMYDYAAMERGARVLIEDGQFGVPWEDASIEDRAETMGRVRAILNAALEG